MREIIYCQFSSLSAASIEPFLAPFQLSNILDEQNTDRELSQFTKNKFLDVEFKIKKKEEKFGKKDEKKIKENKVVCHPQCDWPDWTEARVTAQNVTERNTG